MSVNSTKVFEDNSFLPVVYEANFTEYLSTTLNTKPGFRDAEVFQRDPRNDGGDPEVKNPDRVHKYITVLFEIDNKESIDRYLNEEEKEKSSSELRLSRYRAEIADQSKALEEDRQRINSLRENIRLRRVALEDARSRYQTGNEYLEESHKLLERARFVLLALRLGFEIFFLFADGRIE
ncbi:6619_t:CDS:2 [Racocetra fulgida]|uniref:6619_t:CDS:1 n=1 Tax=Racocetra fulgida TaxID=60492 RepID=A0A9N9FQ07_9GLOM|nr:6619_t:CDS:2 [Racocetra fulgida]